MTEEERREFDLYKSEVRTLFVLVRTLYRFLSHDPAIRNELAARLQTLLDYSDPQIEHLSREGLRLYELRLKETQKFVIETT